MSRVTNAPFPTGDSGYSKRLADWMVCQPISDYTVRIRHWELGIPAAGIPQPEARPSMAEAARDRHQFAREREYITERVVGYALGELVAAGKVVRTRDDRYYLAPRYGAVSDSTDEGRG